MNRPLLLMVSAAAAVAGCAPTAERPETTAAAAKAPPLEYRSAFEGYRAFSDDKPLPWRDANEGVKDGGDHTGHAAKGPAQGKPPAEQEHRGHQ